VFISLGGHWPCYTYRRYYWYGYHPYRWYGDYPPGYVIAGDTYNYYYYNDAPRGEALDEAHQKLEETPPAEPAQESQADRYFEQAVKAFEAGDYAAAAARFNDAQQLAPDDIVLPFAHVQALFAGGEYQKAAEFLRKALIRTSPDKEGVFYPRGLYTDESVLQRQLDQLARAVRLSPSDSDLELLLGYQLLGMDRLDEAVGHLQNAGLDSKNSQAATVLMSLLEKLIEADNNNADSGQQPADEPGEQQSGSPKVKPAGQRADSAPEEHDNNDVDLHALAISAETWLLQE
jgi:tetratricopeptide (TPR) repeat protein